MTRYDAKTGKWSFDNGDDWSGLKYVLWAIAGAGGLVVSAVVLIVLIAS